MNTEDFKILLQSKIAENRQSFEGLYRDKIESLMALSKAEIDSIVPGGADVAAYDNLITVVKEASRANIEQAELKARIEELGDVAVKIASKVPGLLS
ncbi:hypothetical protein L2750_03385 [Shewanella submarina]|uniref:Uncharacterized protein n=1 Tax=Shewanella submarina TaxID=2016376 RepID=A0ABV7GJR0_9GAMM|nr:hypothetical protein [Shewanella submarina]MCL1036200.1 hypothetical protein [Shewanella submarina]